MGCRKDQASLTPAERSAYVNAVKALKTSVPSQMGLGNRYDDYVRTHEDAMLAETSSGPGWAHRGPAFLPWHREFLRRFELDLQAVDPTVTIPYWDWTVNNSPDPTAPGSPWTDDFMGPQGNPVPTGPFAAGSWTLNIHEAGSGEGPDLIRQFGVNTAALPTPQQVTDCLAVTPYYVAPWRAWVNYAAQQNPVQPSFCNRLEGWYGLGSIHNRVHLWVGGSMLPGTSPNDPVFFLHHCNIDRLWARWQRDHPAESYHPSGAGGEVGLPGHNLTDPMQPWGGGSTVASVLNHHALGYWYASDPPEVTLLTPSLAFTNIPEGIGGTGVTTYRAVVFEILSCDAVHLEISAGPTAPFGAPLGLTATVPATHFAPPGRGRLWVSYTSTNAGASATGSVTVRVVETGQSWVVNLAANTVARPKSAVALVLDHSGSMSEDAGDGQPKVDKLRAAVGAFVDVMLPGDGLGIVRFDDQVDRLLNVTDVGPQPATPGSGRERAAAILASHAPADTLDPRGNTSIGGGVQEGKSALDTAPATSPPYSVRAMVVLTDGMENTPPMLADVAGSITANTYAIGFGTPANISVAALNTLTQNHNGYLVVTGAITPDEQFRLTKYFLQALAGITNADVVLDPQGELVLGATHRIPFRLTEADMGADIILLSPAPWAIDFALETPDGTLIDAGVVATEPAVSLVQTSRVRYYRAALPALAADPAGSHAGQWHAVLRLGRRAAGLALEQTQGRTGRTLPYSLLAHAYSNLRLTAAARQDSYEPGARVVITAGLTEYDVPVERRATVWAEVTRPDRGQTSVTLAETEPGQFAGSFTAAQAGVYTVRLRATGVTFRGQAFQREQTLTAVTMRGGDAPPATDGTGVLVDWLEQRDERLCELLACLLDGLRDSELGKRLRERGVDLARLEECLKRYCARRTRPRPRPTERVAPAARPVEAAPVTTAELRGLLATLQRELLTAEGGAEFDMLAEGAPNDLPPLRPDEEHKMPPGPMFDLSPEDKAAEETSAPGGRDRARRAAEPPAPPEATEAAAAPAPPARRPAFDLSPEDKAVERGEDQQGDEQPPRRRNRPR